MKSKKDQSAFTLIELVIVVSILAILAGVMIPRVSKRMAKSRDARRIADVRAVQAAIDSFHADTGKYPKPTKNSKFGNWDVSHDQNFIRELVDKGYLTEEASDPINDNDYHYRYYLYDQGSYGCEGSSSFYVLGIRKFETNEFTDQNRGFFKCTGRDWGTTFAYVTGGGATFKQ